MFTVNTELEADNPNPQSVLRRSGGHYIQHPKRSRNMTDKLINEVEHKLDKLISLCTRLQQENESLRAEKSEWQQERTRLIEKNQLARTRVEAMIERLRNMEA